METSHEPHVNDILNKTLDENLQQVSDILNALGNPNRLQIVSSLSKGETEFSQLQETTGLSKTALVHHLKTLTENNIIENPSRGTYTFNEDGREILTSIIDTYAGTLWKKKREEHLQAELFTKAYERRHEKMELDVKIVELETMRVASFRAKSETPEHDSAQLLANWAQGKELLNDLESHPIFGFNNPSPRKGEKEYGYEFWIKVDDDFTDEEATIKEVSGGRYAVTTCHNLMDVGDLWMKLYNWVKESEYEYRDSECLEKPHDFGASDKELVLDLYEPIK